MPSEDISSIAPSTLNLRYANIFEVHANASFDAGDCNRLELGQIQGTQCIGDKNPRLQ